MSLLRDPQTWISFLTLVVLEIVLGIDNILFLIVLVERLPVVQRASARLVGLGFAMITRIALLFSVTWLATLRTPWLRVSGLELSGRDLILFAGGAFLIVQSIIEIRETLVGSRHLRRPGPVNGFWLVVVQVGVLDIAFSLDSVFTAVGLANHVEVMVAAIVISVLVMMAVAAAVSAFINRFPSVKVLALAFLVLVGAALIGEALDLDVPKGYLYFSMLFAAVVEGLNLKVRGAQSRS